MSHHTADDITATYQGWISVAIQQRTNLEELLADNADDPVYPMLVERFGGEIDEITAHIDGLIVDWSAALMKVPDVPAQELQL